MYREYWYRYFCNDSDTAESTLTMLLPQIQLESPKCTCKETNDNNSIQHLPSIGETLSFYYLLARNFVNFLNILAKIVKY